MKKWLLVFAHYVSDRSHHRSSGFLTDIMFAVFTLAKPGDSLHGRQLLCMVWVIVVSFFGSGCSLGHHYVVPGFLEAHFGSILASFLGSGGSLGSHFGGEVVLKWFL